MKSGTLPFREQCPVGVTLVIHVHVGFMRQDWLAGMVLKGP